MERYYSMEIELLESSLSKSNILEYLNLISELIVYKIPGVHTIIVTIFIKTRVINTFKLMFLKVRDICAHCILSARSFVMWRDDWISPNFTSFRRGTGGRFENIKGKRIYFSNLDFQLQFLELSIG